MAIIDDNSPLSVVQQMQQGQSAGQALNRFTLPAVNQFMASPGNTAFATNAPINTPAQNNINVTTGTLNQVPIGGYGLGALQSAGYSRGNPLDIFNQNQNQIRQAQRSFNPNVPAELQFSREEWMQKGPTAASYARLSEGQRLAGMDPSLAIGGANYLLSQPSQSLPQTQYAAPLLSGERSPFYDPSVGALRDAQRSTNIYGQQVINPAGGGQIISGRGPTVGFLGNARSINKDTGKQIINTPSGGTIISGGSKLRKPQRNAYTGQMWSLGGWY